MKRGLVLAGRFVAAGALYFFCFLELIEGFSWMAGHVPKCGLLTRELLVGGSGALCTFVSLLLVWAVARWRMPATLTPRKVRWMLAALLAVALWFLRSARYWLWVGFRIRVHGMLPFWIVMFAEFVAPIAWILMALCLPSRGIEAEGRKA